LKSSKKIFFLSDFHLGAPNHADSLIREKIIVDFLDRIENEAAEIFILGDLFDFWFEYKTVVPKGYVRILGKLARLRDAGIPIHFFVGNHDMWMRNYFQQELDIPVYMEPKLFERVGKIMMIGHGDGLGPGDHGYKMLKRIFRNPICQWLFGILPPAIGIGLASFSSRKSRAKTGKQDEIFEGPEKEWLVQYCKAELQKSPIDYFLFGHRHLPMDIPLNEKSRYLNLGDWISHFTYAVWDGEHMTLRKYEP
jgi:UDP-2,3-diacylglucosamine hydrolase